MRIAVPTEVKDNENRVGLTPAGVLQLTRRGHDVLVQASAGVGSGITDEDYVLAGASIISDPDQLWAEGELVVKVKEPIAEEFGRLRSGLTLFTYLHLAASRACADALLSSGTRAIAYEGVRDRDGRLPLLAPMSEIAGRLSVIVGTYNLLRPFGGRGIQPGGVAGTSPARTVVIGAGVAGEHAAANAIGLGSAVTMIDVSLPRLREMERQFAGRISTAVSSPYEIERLLEDADLVIGSALVPGAGAPKLVTNEMVRGMREGSVLVDIAIDQGGCFEDSRVTTHSNPTFRVHGSTFYCVANMPGAVPVSSTTALTNATTPYVLALASGVERALESNTGLREGLAVEDGRLMHSATADSLGMA
ncbi:alanine dehydrogenase [Microbacterium sp. QXD-8]|uniref:Alanine dehydrogenase n=1 Tax=Microbacterium psychrotolerans TaxID=3068321 RepID=A0ABU0YW07_9MICO|nr:alanine dehydrogenase [Microbacterium sp. QXD-8]MDQ7876516.1 alanine dehydrogenase [Microbacterium sp. QXD-8]